MRISVITPSIRPELCKIVEKCLDRQTFKDFEWLLVYGGKEFDDFTDAGHRRPYFIESGNKPYYSIQEPPKKEGDFYNLNKAWNQGLKVAKGELFVSIVDGLWFPPDTLERLWQHYEADPMKCIGLIGHQYDRIEDNKPEHMVWQDPRIRTDTHFYQIPPYDLELCIASLPLKGVREVGGFDEEFDKFPAWSEKELCCRMEKLGYTFWIDQSCEYRAIYHPRLNSDWDKKYPESTAYFQKCYKEIQEDKRLHI